MNIYLELFKDAGITLLAVLAITFIIFLFEERQRIKEMFWEGKE